MNRRQGSRSEAKSSWYTPLLALYLQSRSLVTAIAIGVVLVIAGIIGFNYIQDTRNTQAQEFLGAILLEYERSNYRIALDGSGELLGLTDIVERYGSTPAGNTARFYAANAHFELKEYDQALGHFTDFKASDDFLGASATAGRAAIYELQGDYQRSGDLFRRAADMDDENVVRAPYYLRSAARAYVESGELDAAKEVILDAKKSYPETDLLDEFNYMLGMVIARQS